MTLDLAARLQPKHLRLVQAIAEHGQVSLAARKLTMTQPAASRMLLEVERLVEAPLFERRPKGMVPTPLGEVLARGASAVLHGLDATAREMEGFKAGLTGTVRIGAVTGGAVSFIVPAIQSLETAAQEADIHVDVAPSDQLMAGLINNRYDFILARLPPGTDTRRFEVMRGRVEEIVFLARAGHPLAEARALALGDLAGWPWVIQGHGTPLRQAVEEAFQNWAVPTPRDLAGGAGGGQSLLSAHARPGHHRAQTARDHHHRALPPHHPPRPHRQPACHPPHRPRRQSTRADVRRGKRRWPISRGLRNAYAGRVFAQDAAFHRPWRPILAGRSPHV